MDDEIQEIMEILDELQQDNAVSKNIRQKVSQMKIELQNSDKENMSLAVNKILSELDDLSNDVNLPAFTRTQIWHLASRLESLS